MRRKLLLAPESSSSAAQGQWVKLEKVGFHALVSSAHCRPLIPLLSASPPPGVPPRKFLFLESRLYLPSNSFSWSPALCSEEASSRVVCYFFCNNFFFFSFFGHPMAYGVPRPGIRSKSQSTVQTSTGPFKPPCRIADGSCVLALRSCRRSRCATSGTPSVYCYVEQLHLRAFQKDDRLWRK